MTTDSIYAACWNLFWILALETLLVVGLTILVQRQVQSALGRRSLWQISLVALSALILLEATGWGRGLAGWAGTRITEMHGIALKSPATVLLNDESPPPTPALHVSPEFRRPAAGQWVAPASRGLGLRVSPEFRQQVAERLQANKNGPGNLSVASLTPPHDQPAGPGPLLTGGPLASQHAFAAAACAETKAGLELSAWWLGPVWLLGTAMVAFRAGCARLLFFLFRLKNHSATEPAVLDQVQKLAQRLGLNSSVRVVQSAGLQGPIAFGIVRPTIGLPSTFATAFTPVQQEAVLSHELAHLAARDPAWYLLADLVTAALWWHPLAWWSRRQLHAASEIAADEASLVLRNGPHILAECLVEFGRRLPS
ncbi:MAG: M56 family metallopeptidase, partial [Chloroflexi bacterium]|nr:M56 family metallopeptidase [Chloroflexota bacterium]